MTKIDPYNRKEKYKKRYALVPKTGILDSSKENSDLVIQYLDDMEHRLNVSIASVKGGRNLTRLIIILKCLG
jgi:hypothetical protein